MPHVSKCAGCSKTSAEVIMKWIEPVGLLCFRCWWAHSSCLNCGRRPSPDAPSRCGCEDYRHGLSGELRAS
jgi:hypothetical protein